MKTLLIQEQQVMNGFCYAFSKALLEKLKDIVKKNEVSSKEKITEAICHELQVQITFSISDVTDKYRLDEFISNIEEFLAIFEEKEAGCRSFEALLADGSIIT